MIDSDKEKLKVEAIYPLSNMQQGILFHHLTAKNDQGFLNVQCTIDGSLNLGLLKQSWDLAIKRHPILRTSVHWEKVKTPIKLVIPNASIDWKELDWATETENVQIQKLTEFKINNKNVGLNFQKQPLTKVSLIKTKKDSHYLVWCCHHLLLDGWSSSIILKDVFTFYDALVNNNEANLEPIPSYKSYLSWLKETNVNEVKNFWIKTFKGFEKPFLFNKNQSQLHSIVTNYINLSTETSQKAQTLAKANQVTLNTFFQGLWSLIISKYSNCKDITYGNTVSGRSGSFPNIELLADMFANVLPVRTLIDNNLSIKDWLKNIQLQQLEARKYEQFTTGEITEWIENTSENIFDSLFIFENFPWEDIKVRNINVHSLKSGITTTYPLTLTIKTGASIEIYLFSDELLFSNKINQWFLSRFEEIINLLHNNKSFSIDSLLDNITPITSNVLIEVSEKNKTINSIISPQNKTQLELLKIWETLLNKNNISITDNFFEIGGKSLLAIKMFTLIEKKLKIKISPITLLEHSSIEALSKYIQEDKIIASWNYVVPIKTSGTKKPLFCIHGGGGYVFFFNPIANALNEETPVYAIQPSGISGNEKMHQSIKEMAIDYAKEIKDIQPNGPYNLLVYCFSPAVGIEIANIFKKLGETTNLIVIDSITNQEDFTDPTRIKMRISGFLKRFTSNPFNAIKLMISNNYERFLEPKVIKLFASSNKKNLEKVKQNLIRIYKLYEWNKKHPGITNLILTKKPDKKLNPTYINAWNDITKQDINVLYTEGLHHQLFSSPYADLLAEKIERVIIQDN